MIKAENNASLLKRFNSYLDEQHMRHTPERDAIVRRVLNITGHFTIEQLKQMLDDDGFYVSKATIYNTVDLLMTLGILRRHCFEGLQAQYEKSNVPIHSHLVCTKCGKVKEVRDNNFIAFMNTRKFTAFTQDYYSLCVYGVCNSCARKQKKKPKQLTP